MPISLALHHGLVVRHSAWLLVLRHTLLALVHLVVTNVALGRVAAITRMSMVNSVELTVGILLSRRLRIINRSSGAVTCLHRLR